MINLTTRDLAYATDWCGVRSGRDYQKFKQMGLTPGKATKISAPIIMESPLNIECRVLDIKSLGSHDMFLAEVVNIKADTAYINHRTGAFLLEDADQLAYSHGNYFVLGKKIGRFGYSVQKKRMKR